jgi:hypothetical protein
MMAVYWFTAHSDCLDLTELDFESTDAPSPPSICLKNTHPQLEEDEEEAMKEGTDLDRLLQVSQVTQSVSQSLSPPSFLFQHALPSTRNAPCISPLITHNYT